MGVVGRLVSNPNQLKGPRFPRLTRALAMRHTIFKDTRAYANNTLAKKGIDFPDWIQCFGPTLAGRANRRLG